MNQPRDDLAEVLAAFDRRQRSEVARFLRTPTGRGLVLATDPVDRVRAVHNWLNGHGLPPGASQALAPDQGGSVRVLPDPATLPAMSLHQALETRRSHYRYSSEPLRLSPLSDLLHHALRISPRAQPRTGAGGSVALSSAPSAGACHPVRVHLAVRAVDGLDPGVYAYDRMGHTVTRTWMGNITALLRTIYGQAEFAHAVPVTLLLTVTLPDPVARYGPRHYRTLHLDAGIVVQNLYLVATALGLGGCAVAGYRDGRVSDLLGCTELPMSVFPVGLPAGVPGPPRSTARRGRTAR